MSSLSRSRCGVLAQRPRVVVVAVDERHLLVQRPGAVEQRVWRCRLRQGDGGKHEEREREARGRMSRLWHAAKGSRLEALGSSKISMKWVRGFA